VPQDSKNYFDSKPKIPYTLVFVNYLYMKPIRAFSIYLEDSLRIISGTGCAENNIKTGSNSAHQN
jgi:hypothetical protein